MPEHIARIRQMQLDPVFVDDELDYSSELPLLDGEAARRDIGAKAVSGHQASTEFFFLAEDADGFRGDPHHLYNV